MRKIAVFTSGSGAATKRLVSLFNEGNRIRVDVVVAENADGEMRNLLSGNDVMLKELTPTDIMAEADALAACLQERGVEYIALDEYGEVVPTPVAQAFEGRIFALSSPDEGPREVMSALQTPPVVPKTEAVGVETSAPETEEVIVEACAPKTEDVIVETAPETEDAAVKKSVDEEWAETLKMNFDPAQVRQTPPPMPGAAVPPVVPNQMPPQGNGFMGNNPAHNYRNRAYVQNNNLETMPPTYLIWSVLMTIFCCFIPGIVAIIYSASVSSRYAQGDVEGARRASRNAEIWIIVSFVLGVLSATLYLPIMLITG